MNGNLTTTEDPEQPDSRKERLPPAPKRDKGPASRPDVLRFLVQLTVLAVFCMTVMLIFLYYTDSFGETAGEDQYTLLQLIFAVSLLLCISAFCGAVLDLWYSLTFKKAAPLAGTAIYLVLALLGTALVAGTGFMLSFAGGNR